MKAANDMCEGRILMTHEGGYSAATVPFFAHAVMETLANENSITELSIGMSGDYKDALPFKPTYIRLGTILFGERN